MAHCCVCLAVVYDACIVAKRYVLSENCPKKHRYHIDTMWYQGGSPTLPPLPKRGY